MVNVANQTHAGILNLIAQAVSPRDARKPTSNIVCVWRATSRP